MKKTPYTDGSTAGSSDAYRYPPTVSAELAFSLKNDGSTRDDYTAITSATGSSDTYVYPTEVSAEPLISLKNGGSTRDDYAASTSTAGRSETYLYPTEVSAEPVASPPQASGNPVNEYFKDYSRDIDGFIRFCEYFNGIPTLDIPGNEINSFFQSFFPDGLSPEDFDKLKQLYARLIDQTDSPSSLRNVSGKLKEVVTNVHRIYRQFQFFAGILDPRDLQAPFGGPLSKLKERLEALDDNQVILYKQIKPIAINNIKTLLEYCAWVKKPIKGPAPDLSSLPLLPIKFFHLEQQFPVDHFTSISKGDLLYVNGWVSQGVIPEKLIYDIIEEKYPDEYKILRSKPDSPYLYLVSNELLAITIEDFAKFRQSGDESKYLQSNLPKKIKLIITPSIYGLSYGIIKEEYTIASFDFTKNDFDTQLINAHVSCLLVKNLVDKLKNAQRIELTYQEYQELDQQTKTLLAKISEANVDFQTWEIEDYLNISKYMQSIKKPVAMGDDLGLRAFGNHIAILSANTTFSLKKIEEISISSLMNYYFPDSYILAKNESDLPQILESLHGGKAIIQLFYGAPPTTIFDEPIKLYEDYKTAMDMINTALVDLDSLKLGKQLLSDNEAQWNGLCEHLSRYNVFRSLGVELEGKITSLKAYIQGQQPRLSISSVLWQPPAGNAESSGCNHPSTPG